MYKFEGKAMPQKNPSITALEFAVSRERDAYNFYMVLAERVDNVEIKKILEELAQEELEHKAKLELELVKMGNTVPAEWEIPTFSEPSTQPDLQPILEMSYKELLMLAMEKEEASFRTYVNLASKINNEESRNVLLAIAEEEVKHKLRFEIEYDILSKQT